MKQYDRRQALTTLGWLGGASLLAGCGRGSNTPVASAATANHEVSAPHGATPPSGASGGGERATGSAPRESAAMATPGWPYAPLDPDAVAARAYAMYPDGGCMYAVVASVLGALAERFGEPYRSFPCEMMRYGDGGVGGWGTLCGVVNGAAALIGLFQSECDRQRREQLISEYCLWYEHSLLPQYQPARPEWAPEAVPSVAGSPLCHVSVSRWSEASGCEVDGMEKKERCRRLAADGAARIVALLNARAVDTPPFAALPPETKACIDCHGPKELADSACKMDCAACHQFPGPHPTVSSGTNKE